MIKFQSLTDEEFARHYGKRPLMFLFNYISLSSPIFDDKYQDRLKYYIGFIHNHKLIEIIENDNIDLISQEKFYNLYKELDKKRLIDLLSIEEFVDVFFQCIILEFLENNNDSPSWFSGFVKSSPKYQEEYQKYGGDMFIIGVNYLFDLYLSWGNRDLVEVQKLYNQLTKRSGYDENVFS